MARHSNSDSINRQKEATEEYIVPMIPCRITWSALRVIAICGMLAWTARVARRGQLIQSVAH
jgi:hypothetical protein